MLEYHLFNFGYNFYDQDSLCIGYIGYVSCITDALDLEWRKQGKEQRNLFAFLGQSKLYDVNDSEETSSDGISIPFKK